MTVYPREPAIFYCAGHKREESSSTPPVQIWGMLYCPESAPDPFCEEHPYPGAGYHCLLKMSEHHDEQGRKRPHTDLTLMWDDDGWLVNLDGSRIAPMRD